MAGHESVKMEYFDKKVKVIFHDGDSIIGTLSNWTSALDNEPDGESIDLNDIDTPAIFEIYVEDIKDIVLLEP